jgi:hypothetical protein
MPKKQPPHFEPETELQQVDRYFNGLPIKEAPGDILVQPTRGDIAKSTRNSPTNCAYAVFLKRSLETTKVYIFETTAYVQTLDERGAPVVYRFIIKNHAATYIKKFDNGEPIRPGGFILHKPSRGKELDYKREQSRKWYNQNKEHARALSRDGYRKRTSPAPRQLPALVRNGTGCVKFLGTVHGKISPHSP